MLTLAQSIISVLAWRIPRWVIASLLKWSVVAALLYVSLDRLLSRVAPHGARLMGTA